MTQVSRWLQPRAMLTRIHSKCLAGKLSLHPTKTRETVLTNSPGCRYEAVMCVAGSTRAWEKWTESTGGSNYGDKIDVIAPAQNIISARPARLGGGEHRLSGTSSK
jgi:hypothetical protein